MRLCDQVGEDVSAVSSEVENPGKVSIKVWINPPLTGTSQDGRKVRGDTAFGCITTTVLRRLRGRRKPSLARRRISEEGVAVGDLKEISLPFTTPVLDTYGSTLAREALTSMAMVIGATESVSTAANLVVSDVAGFFLSRPCIPLLVRLRASQPIARSWDSRI